MSLKVEFDPMHHLSSQIKDSTVLSEDKTGVILKIGVLLRHGVRIENQILMKCPCSSDTQS